MAIKEGARVKVTMPKSKDPSKKHLGTVRFVGTIEGKKGTFVGVELDEPNGNHDGSVAGHHYFKCIDGHGVFVRDKFLEVVRERPTSSSSAKRPASSSSRSSKTPTKPKTSSSKVPSKLAAGSKSSSSSSKTSSKKPSTSLLDAPDTLSEPTSPAPDDASVHSEPLSASAEEAASPVFTSPVRHEVTHTESSASLDDSAMSFTSQMERSTFIEREQDPMRIRELEKIKAELAHAQDKIVLLERQKNDFSQQARDASHQLQIQRERFEADIAVKTEEAKIADVDRNIAQEESLALKEQILDLEAELQEVQLEVEILREEVAVSGQASAESGVPAEKPAGQVTDLAAFKTLQHKNNQLTQALLKLRDQSVTASRENQEFRALVSQQQAEIAALEKTLDLKTEALAKAEKELNAQLERADASSGVESMTESLINNKLALEQRCADLEQRVRSLEDTVELDNAIQMAYVENERDLEQELSTYAKKITFLDNALHALAAQYREQQNVINSYREKVSGLEGDLTSVREVETEKVMESIQSANTKVASLHAKLAQSQTRERAKTIEAALHKLEADQSAQHISLLVRFLPETFVDTDYEALKLLMLLSRFQVKADILSNHVAEAFHVGADVKHVKDPSSDITLDQLSFGTALTMHLTSLKLNCRYVEKAMARMDMASYGDVGKLLPQLESHEQALDAMLHEAQSGGLDVTHPLDPITNLDKALQHVCDSQLKPQVPPPTYQAISDDSSVAALSSELVAVDLVRLQDVFRRSASTSGQLDPAFGPLLVRLEHLGEQANSVRATCKRIVREVSETESNTSFDGDTRSTVASIGVQLTRAALSTRRAIAAVQTHVHGSVTLRTLDLETAMQMCANNMIDLTEKGDAARKARDEGADEHLTPSHVLGLLEAASSKLDNVANRIGAGDFDVDKAEEIVSAGDTPPWELRAERMRRATKDTLDMPEKLKEQTEKAVSLEQELRVQSKKLREARVLHEAARSRIDSLKHAHAKEVDELKAKMADQRKEHEERSQQVNKILDNLEKHIEELTRERDEERKKLKSRRMARAGTGGGSARQLAVLQAAVSQARAEAARAKASVIVNELLALPSLGVGRLRTFDSKAAKAVSEASSLVKELHHKAASVHIVDLASKPKTNLAAAIAAERLDLEQRAAHAKNRLIPLIAACTGKTAEESTGARVSTDYAEVMKERADLKVMGSIRLASQKDAAVAKKKLFLSPEEFARLHSTFAQ